MQIWEAKGSSIITDLFTVVLTSTVTRTQCGHSTTRFDIADHISLDLPESGACTLEDCLRQFSQPTVLAASEAVVCDVGGCKHHGKLLASKKSLQLSVLPAVLAIHLKRNRFSSAEQRAYKVNSEVMFPLECLDMMPFVPTAQVASAEHALYDLASVCVHLGSTGDLGHYITYGLSASGSWYKFNDAVVTRAASATVAGACGGAYVLFYTRRRPREGAVAGGRLPPLQAHMQEARQRNTATGTSAAPPAPERSVAWEQERCGGDVGTPDRFPCRTPVIYHFDSIGSHCEGADSEGSPAGLIRRWLKARSAADAATAATAAAATAVVAVAAAGVRGGAHAAAAAALARVAAASAAFAQAARHSALASMRVRRAEVPDQPRGNCWDCGVYLVEYARSFMRLCAEEGLDTEQRSHDWTHWFVQADVDRRRMEMRRVLNDLRDYGSWWPRTAAAAVGQEHRPASVQSGGGYFMIWQPQPAEGGQAAPPPPVCWVLRLLPSAEGSTVAVWWPAVVFESQQELVEFNDKFAGKGHPELPLSGFHDCFGAADSQPAQAELAIAGYLGGSTVEWVVPGQVRSFRHYSGSGGASTAAAAAVPAGAWPRPPPHPVCRCPAVELGEQALQHDELQVLRAQVREVRALLPAFDHRLQEEAQGGQALAAEGGRVVPFDRADYTALRACSIPSAAGSLRRATLYQNVEFGNVVIDWLDEGLQEGQGGGYVMDAQQRLWGRGGELVPWQERGGGQPVLLPVVEALPLGQFAKFKKGFSEAPEEEAQGGGEAEAEKEGAQKKRALEQDAAAAENSRPKRATRAPARFLEG